MEKTREHQQFPWTPLMLTMRWYFYFLSCLLKRLLEHSRIFQDQTWILVLGWLPGCLSQYVLSNPLQCKMQVHHILIRTIDIWKWFQGSLVSHSNPWRGLASSLWSSMFPTPHFMLQRTNIECWTLLKCKKQYEPHWTILCLRFERALSWKWTLYKTKFPILTLPALLLTLYKITQTE